MNIFIQKDGQQLGPFDETQIRDGIASEKFQADDLARAEEELSWQPLRTLLRSAVPGQPSASPSLWVANNDPRLPEEATKLFVDENYEFYSEKWDRMGRRKTVISWNWAAFFLGTGWIFYRKMYLYGCLAIVLLSTVQLLEGIFGASNTCRFVYSGVFWVAFGLFGNFLYELHVAKKLRQLAASGLTADPIRLQIVKQGGTNLGLCIGFFFLVSLLAMLPFALTILHRRL